MWSLPAEGKFLLIQKQSDAYRRLGDLGRRRAPQFVIPQFQQCDEYYSKQKRLKNKGVQKNERKEKIPVRNNYHSV